jgi:hypothetical protein
MVEVMALHIHPVYRDERIILNAFIKPLDGRVVIIKLDFER